MEWILLLLNSVSDVETTLLLLGILYAIYLWIRGIGPVLFRLGKGLAKRRIAIFAKGDNLTGIKSLILDSRLFKPTNILEVTRKEDMESSKNASIFLIYWPDWGIDIDTILAKKSDSCPLIVYQPYDKGRIPDDKMKQLDGKRHTAVTNFRGRLLNDIVTAMITTSYEKE